MTTALDIKFLPKVYNIIDKVGVNAVFTVITYNSSTGRPSTTETTYTVKTSPPLNYDKRYVNGTTVKESDCYIIVPGQGLLFTPTIGHRVTIAGTQYNVVSVKKHYSGDSVAAYEIQLRT